jgi:hypothetical protein
MTKSLLFRGITVAILAATATVSQAQTQANVHQWLPHMPTNGGHHLDLDGNGRVDVIKYDASRDGYYDSMRADANRDGYLETVLFDLDQNGHYEQAFADQDRNGSLETFFWINQSQVSHQSSQAILDEFFRSGTGYSYDQVARNPRIQAEIIARAQAGQHEADRAQIAICGTRYYYNGRYYCS